MQSPYPVPHVATQCDMVHTIDLDDASPISVCRLVGTNSPVRGRAELWPMGRDGVLHAPPNMHLPDGHGPAIGMMGRFCRKGRHRERARRLGLLPSQSGKEPETESKKNKEQEKTLHTFTSCCSDHNHTKR